VYCKTGIADSTGIISVNGSPQGCGVSTQPLLDRIHFAVEPERDVHNISPFGFFDPKTLTVYEKTTCRRIQGLKKSRRKATELVSSARRPCNEPIAPPGRSGEPNRFPLGVAKSTRKSRVASHAGNGRWLLGGRVVIVGRPPIQAASGPPLVGCPEQLCCCTTSTPCPTPRPAITRPWGASTLGSNPQHSTGDGAAKATANEERTPVDTATPATQRTRNPGTTRHVPGADVHTPLSWHALRWTVGVRHRDRIRLAINHEARPSRLSCRSHRNLKPPGGLASTHRREPASRCTPTSSVRPHRPRRRATTSESRPEVFSPTSPCQTPNTWGPRSENGHKQGNRRRWTGT
jgi:hypothetical protein